MLISDSELPHEVWELDQVLRWLGKSPNQPVSKTVNLFFQEPWVRSTDTGRRVFFVGTRKFSNGHRLILLDEPTILSIQSSYTFPPSTASTPSPPPHPLPTSSSSYANVVRLELRKPELKNKLIGLRKSNPGRAKKVVERTAKFEVAKKATSKDGKAGKVVVAVACGAYEIVTKKQKKRKVLEIGWSRWELGTLKVVTKHCIIEENSAFRNGKYTPNRIDDFQHGESIICSFADARTLLISDLNSPSPSTALTLVANGLPFPVTALELEFHLSAFQASKWDVGTLYRTHHRVFGKASHSRLQDMLEAYQIPYKESWIHNAGNDARFILDLFRIMTSTK